MKRKEGQHRERGKTNGATDRRAEQNNRAERVEELKAYRKTGAAGNMTEQPRRKSNKIREEQRGTAEKHRAAGSAARWKAARNRRFFGKQARRGRIFYFLQRTVRKDSFLRGKML